MGRFTIFAAVGVLLLAGLPPLASADGTGSSSHPYFDDGGTLTWFHSLAEAKRAARREGKVIFVEYGRRRCGSCRVLVSSVVPDRRVRDRIARAAVGLASECDRPEASIQNLFARRLAGARMLPFVGFLTADGEWITGFAGSTGVDRFLAHLRRAEAHVGRPVTPPRAPRVRPGPCEPCAPPARKPAAPRPARVVKQPTTIVEQPAPVVKQPAPVVRQPGTVVKQPSRYPAPRLAGNPDAGEVPELSGCRAPTLPRRTGPLPPPRIVINPPVKVRRDQIVAPPAHSRPVARAESPPDRGGSVLERAREAAQEGRWGQVLQLTAGASPDARLASLRQQAHLWAHSELDEAVSALAEGRYEDALAAVKGVLLQMQGEPEAVDAEGGLVAIRTMLELRFLNAEGPVAPVVRQNTYEELRGTRWASLFSS